MGLLRRRYGLACDNVRALEVVTAAGALRTASATENPDLFCAARGGGRGLGVVTRFEFVGLDEEADGLRASVYGSSRDRPAEVRSRYDPTGLFEAASRRP